LHHATQPLIGARSLLTKSLRKLRIGQRAASFHFIHIPKNAGESVRAALGREPDISVTSPYHFRYVDIADRIGPQVRCFAVIRNPWSRTASRYHFGRQNAARWPADDARRSYILNASFADFVNDRKVLPIPEHPDQPWMGPLSSWLDQLEWICDEKGRVVCDCLRMEHLQEDLENYLARRLELPKRNVTKERFDYRAMYTDELAERVAEYFRRDIQYFGFEFDSPARRNYFIRHPAHA
jgi:hypothetical protein